MGKGGCGVRLRVCRGRGVGSSVRDSSGVDSDARRGVLPGAGRCATCRPCAGYAARGAPIPRASRRATGGSGRFRQGASPWLALLRRRYRRMAHGASGCSPRAADPRRADRLALSRAARRRDRPTDAPGADAPGSARDAPRVTPASSGNTPSHRCGDERTILTCDTGLDADGLESTLVSDPASPRPSLAVWFAVAIATHPVAGGNRTIPRRRYCRSPITPNVYDDCSSARCPEAAPGGLVRDHGERLAISRRLPPRECPRPSHRLVSGPVCCDRCGRGRNRSAWPAGVARPTRSGEATLRCAGPQGCARYRRAIRSDMPAALAR